jgi:phage terminase small subunit
MTPKQEKFAQCIADGMNQADAYRAAYDASNMKDSSIYVNASKLLSDTKVAQRVKELKEQLSSKALWTRADSVRALQNAISIAENKDNAAGLVAAIKELNAMHGFNEPSKLELTGGMQNVNKVVFEVVNP